MFSDDEEAYYFAHPDYMYDTEDSEPYYDDDDYYEDDFGFDAYTVKMLETARFRCKLEDETDDVGPVIFQPKSLVDVCCKYLAVNFPFAYLQDRFPPVPDDLQLKVITYSFPEKQDQIRKYAEFSRPSVDLAFQKAMCTSDNVTNMMQIGFRLSANVDGHYVTIHFDRGKITSAQCSCGDSSGWCYHVLATAVKRIKYAGKLDKSQLRLPVSDALNTLSREQLLKFSQYLLYHHQNHKVVETAQGLIDKLVDHHGNYGDEDINVVQGAPDPTAGPGLDEESHWFMCDKGFKEKCHFIINETLQALGFACLENSENYSLTDLWYKNRCQTPLVKDEVDVALGSEFYSCSRHQSVSLKILETVLELLQDDSTTGLTAIKSCTEQVVSRLSRRSYRSVTRSDPLNRFLCHSSVSPAMGFTARPFRSWTLCDELSRLWQVTVLNPKLKTKEREQVAQELFNWNQEVQTGSNADLLVRWNGLEVAYNLCQHINWNSLEMQGIIDGPIPAHYSISGITLVEVKLEHDQLLHCHLPYCFTYGSVTLDILTWCAIIHTLEVFNYRTTAVKIGFCLSIALITLYQCNADSRAQLSGLPIVQKCCLDYMDSKNTADQIKKKKKEANQQTEVKKTKKHCNQQTPNGTDKKKAENSSEEQQNDCLCPLIWPSDALVSLRCVAFLHNVLWSNKSKTEPLLASQRQQHAIGKAKFSYVISNILDTESLVFQLGVIGLLLPKFPMSALKQEVELYDIENWLTFQLVDMKPPSQNDLDLLHSLCRTAMKGGSHRLLSPCSSFTRVVLYHNYKELSILSDDVLGLVFHTLEFAVIQDNQACPQNLFEFSFAVPWCKLAELTLSILVVGKTSHVERTIKCLLNKNGVLGEGLLKLQLSSEDVKNRHLLQSTLRAKSWICFGLAKALLERIKRSSKSSSYNATGHKCISITEILTGVTDRTLEVFPPVSSPSDIMSLKKLAIRLGAHSAYLEKTSDHSYSDGSAVRWLIETSIDCGLWGVSCLLSSHDDVTNFLHHSEAITLCRQLLKKKDDCGVNMVKEVLLSLLRHAVNTETVDKIKDMVQLCSEYKDVCSVLIPWLCEHLRDIARTKTVHSESLFCASEEMFRCYKERLFQTIIENQRLTNLDGNMGLRQLFAEESEDETEEQCKPCPFPNPYMTSHPHPFIELSFELGMMGLNSLSNGDVNFKRSGYMRRHEGQRSKRGHLKQLCDLVCYITNRKWLHQSQEEHKDMPSLSGSFRGDIDESYLTRLVNDLLKADMSPMMLMILLCEIACKLQEAKDPVQFDDNPELKKEILRNVVQEVPHLRLLLDRIETKFKNLLLGSKMKDIVRSVKRGRRSSPRELRADLEYCKIDDSTLRDTLLQAKVVHEVSDPSGSSFEKLVHDIENLHKDLKSVLDGIVSGEESPRPTDNEIFLNPFFLWPFIGQEYARRHSLEDFLN